VKHVYDRRLKNRFKRFAKLDQMNCTDCSVVYTGNSMSIDECEKVTNEYFRVLKGLVSLSGQQTRDKLMHMYSIMLKCVALTEDEWKKCTKISTLRSCFHDVNERCFIVKFIPINNYL